MADVFVSYSRRDRTRVAPLVAAIASTGWSVWWDPEIVPGQEFDRLIDSELSAARAVLVVWTKDSVESRWVRGEAREAAERDILVPVRFDGATLPVDLRAFHTIDFDDAGAGGLTPQVRQMLHALGESIARGPADPPSSLARQAKEAWLPTASDRVEICVLPFSNLGGDPEQQYFSDGITEDIITELSRWRSLSVRSRAASFRYRGVAVDVQLVARELGVRFIVEGSVRRMGAGIRITAQVIDAETGSHVWAEKFDCAADGIFSAQDRVVRTIVGTLVGRVRASDVERARRKPPASLAAYEYVLKGNAQAWDDPAGATEATRLFEQAIAVDPGYGLAHALLASMRAQQWREDDSGSDALLDEALSLALRAVALDEGESTCHSLLAQIYLQRRAFDLALQYMRRAIEINPGNQWNVADMGFVLVHLGESEQALEWFRRAREVDPYFDPPWYWRTLGMAHLFLHRDAEALATLEHLSASHYRTALLRAACHARLGDLDAAHVDAARCLALKPTFSVGRYMTKLALRSPTDVATIGDALRLAGLPE